MEFPVRTGAPAKQKTACAVLPVFEGRTLKGATHEVDVACGGALSQLVKAGDAAAKPGRTLLVPRLQELPPSGSCWWDAGKRRSSMRRR